MPEETLHSDFLEKVMGKGLLEDFIDHVVAVVGVLDVCRGTVLALDVFDVALKEIG